MDNSENIKCIVEAEKLLQKVAMTLHDDIKHGDRSQWKSETLVFVRDALNDLLAIRV